MTVLKKDKELQQKEQDMLHGFLDDVKNLIIHQPQPLPEDVEKLEKKYQEVYRWFEGYSQDELNNICQDEEERLCVRHLFLGKTAAEKFNKHWVNLIQEDPLLTDFKVSAFVATTEAYNLFHGSYLSSSERERIKDWFGGIFGLELTDQFVNSIKAEKMGAVIGYAHSHLCKQDLEKWKDTPSLQSQFEHDVGAYLIHCIETQNCVLKYRESSSTSNRDVLLAAVIAEHQPKNAGKLAARNQADCCFINHDEQTIVVGAMSSNNGQTITQLEAMAKMVLALEQNPAFKDYTIKPMFFHAGFLPVEEEAIGERSQISKNLLKRGLTQEHIESIARAPLFNLLGELSINESFLDVFFKINPHILGCSTLDDFYKRQTLMAHSDREHRSNYILQAFESLIDALNHPAVDFDEATNMYTVVLQGLYHGMRSYFSYLPVHESEVIQDKEVEKLICLSHKINTLKDKIAANKDFSGLKNSFKDLARNYKTKEAIEEEIQSEQEDRQKTQPIHYQLDSEMQCKLEETEHVRFMRTNFTREDAKKLVLKLQEDLSNHYSTSKKILQEIREHIRYQNSLAGYQIDALLVSIADLEHYHQYFNCRPLDRHQLQYLSTIYGKGRYYNNDPMTRGLAMVVRYLVSLEEHELQEPQVCGKKFPYQTGDALDPGLKMAAKWIEYCFKERYISPDRFANKYQEQIESLENISSPEEKSKTKSFSR